MATIWCEPTVNLPGIIEIDQQGRQYFHPKGKATFDVLVIGGSVASGTFATTTAKTYFGQMGTLLEAAGFPTDVTVFAAGAWKSAQELAGFKYSLASGLKPNLVIFINGLNDLTNGTTADAPYGRRVVTKNGARWTPLYHVHDYERRVAIYLRNMSDAIVAAQETGAAVLIVLQPALFEREPLTSVERQLLADSLAPHASKEALTESYEKMRAGLGLLAAEKNVGYLDCSRIFNGESATTFSDMWHFSDFGHQILAKAMTPQIVLALKSSARQSGYRL